MKVPISKGLANHAAPESCAEYREVRREALTGVRIGQPLSRENVINSGADAFGLVEGNMYWGISASPCTTRRGLKNLACAYALCTGTGRSSIWLLESMQSASGRLRRL